MKKQPVIYTHKTQLLAILGKEYPSPRSELHFTSPFQLLISVVLSAQCTDKKVNQVTPSLFTEFPSFKNLAVAPLSRIEEIIHPINYYKTKSKNIIALSKLVLEKHRGEMPKKRDALLELPGVGNKTANVVLGELGSEMTFPVDTHVFRVSRRLGLARGKNVEEVEEELKAQFKPELWRNLHHWLIFHGRRVCKAQSPQCVACALAMICPSKVAVLKNAK